MIKRNYPIKKALLLLITFYSIEVWGLEGNAYTSMIVDGKSWTFHLRIPNRDNVKEALTYRYVIDGDTVVGNSAIPAKKLYAEHAPQFGEVERYLVGGIYEDGLKVYLSPLREQPWLLYDFGLSPGEYVKTYMGSGWIQTAETVEVDGIPLRRLGLSKTKDGPVEVYWVEGIGSCFELIWNTDSWPRFYQYALEECSVNENQLFSFSDFSLPEYSIDETDTERLPYQFMLKEGKEWHYAVHVEGNHQNTDFTCRFVQRGDTIINGEKAYKMYVIKNEEVATYHSSWIEHDRKVFEIPKDKTEKTLMFDFTIRRNSEWYDNAVGLCYLHHTGTYTRQDTEYNSYEFFGAHDEGLFSWVEGIGQLSTGIFTAAISGNFKALCPSSFKNLSVDFKSCYEEGVQIYPQKQQTNEIQTSATNHQYQPESVYDLQGREMKKVKSKNDRALPKGIYIVNGKKVVIK